MVQNVKSQSLVNGNVTIYDPITLEKHRTSIRLEAIEWDTMRRICGVNSISIHEFCSRADNHSIRIEHSRTSRIRAAILQYCLDSGDVFSLPQNEDKQKWQRQEC